LSCPRRKAEPILLFGNMFASMRGLFLAQLDEP